MYLFQKEPLQEKHRRTLGLVVKLLQNLASGITFKPDHKEGYLAAFNDFITENQTRMNEFLNTISQLVSKSIPIALPTFSPRDEVLSLSLIVRHFSNTWKVMEKVRHSKFSFLFQILVLHF